MINCDEKNPKNNKEIGGTKKLSDSAKQFIRALIMRKFYDKWFTCSKVKVWIKYGGLECVADRTLSTVLKFFFIITV